MVLLNLNHFWITQGEWCLKARVCYHFFKDKKTPVEKNFINPSYPKHPKLINWNTKWQNYIFALLCGAFKGFCKGWKVFRKIFWDTKKKCENKNISFFPLFGIRTTRVKRLLLFNVWHMPFPFSLTTEIYEDRSWSINTQLVC